jgi:geranylgeranyl diphosphate synthase, type II
MCQDKLTKNIVYEKLHTQEIAMEMSDRIEKTLADAVNRAQGLSGPPLLSSAVRYAVFPGGHRIRPRLCLAVAQACGDPDPCAADAVAAAIELLHCGSLVHDDLPCFDDAPLRRGKPSVHVEYGEPIALLTGDALIVLAFETLAVGASQSPKNLAALLATVVGAVGAPNGIVAGQAWESEDAVPLADYQRAKTGALFVGATTGGAIAAGAQPALWHTLGALLGEAYQVADDLRDVLCNANEIGKPTGQDAARLRPNAVAQLGIGGAKSRLERLVKAAIHSIPACPGADGLRAQIEAQTALFFPKQLAREAA